MRLADWRSILSDTFREWLTDRAPNQGAALAFYSVLSLGPLLLIVIAIAGMAFGEEAARGHIFGEIRGLVGDEGAAAIQTIIANSRNQASGFWATVIGVVMLLFASTAVFVQLQDALNIIWKVKIGARGFIWMLQKRLLSFAMILSIGFLLLASLAVSAAISAFGEYLGEAMPAVIMEFLHFLLSFGLITLLFAMIFRILPDVYIRWREVWTGAAVTSLLFTAGKSLIGLYLGHSALGSTYGAAGSLMVVLVWIYYSAQIVFLGAEFTQVHARHRKQKSTPIAGRAFKTKAAD